MTKRKSMHDDPQMLRDHIEVLKARVVIWKEDIREVNLARDDDYAPPHPLKDDGRRERGLTYKKGWAEQQISRAEENIERSVKRLSELGSFYDKPESSRVRHLHNGSYPDGYRMVVADTTGREVSDTSRVLRCPVKYRAVRTDGKWIGPWRTTSAGRGYAGDPEGQVIGDAWKHVTGSKDATIDEAGKA